MTNFGLLLLLAKTKSGEVGHPCFQHPQRIKEAIYNADVDRFSHLAIYTAIQEKKVQMPWGWTMAFGILSVIVSVLCFISPPATLAAIIAVIAAFAIVGGIVLLVDAYKLSSVKSDLTRRIHPAGAD